MMPLGDLSATILSALAFVLIHKISAVIISLNSMTLLLSMYFDISLFVCYLFLL
jgi:hypothetical protein